MKIKKLRKLRVNSYEFEVTWCKERSGAEFSFYNKAEEDRPTLRLPCPLRWGDNHVFMVLMHELFEITMVEMNCRYMRQDVQDDYMFVFDHRGMDTATNATAGLLKQFIS